MRNVLYVEMFPLKRCHIQMSLRDYRKRLHTGIGSLQDAQMRRRIGTWRGKSFSISLIDERSVAGGKKTTKTTALSMVTSFGTG